MKRVDKYEIPETDFFRRLGFKTPSEKSQHHKEHKIPFADALHKPEFWIVNAITASRILIQAYSLFLTFTAAEKSQLIVPAILISSSWLADYADGELARNWGVCTDAGEDFDHNWADKLLNVTTAFLLVRSVI